MTCPWPDAEKREKRNAAVRGEDFDYVQCASCTRWFRSIRPIGQPAATHCPLTECQHASGAGVIRARNGFRNRRGLPRGMTIQQALDAGYHEVSGPEGSVWFKPVEVVK